MWINSERCNSGWCMPGYVLSAWNTTITLLHQSFGNNFLLKMYYFSESLSKGVCSGILLGATSFRNARARETFRKCTCLHSWSLTSSAVDREGSWRFAGVTTPLFQRTPAPILQTFLGHASSRWTCIDVCLDWLFHTHSRITSKTLDVPLLRRTVLGSSRGPCYQRNLPVQGNIC